MNFVSGQTGLDAPRQKKNVIAAAHDKHYIIPGLGNADIQRSPLPQIPGVLYILDILLRDMEIYMSGIIVYQN